jgi:hypothetical protein
MTLRKRFELTIGILVGVGLAIAVLSTAASVPVLPIAGATVLALVVAWTAPSSSWTR